MRWVVFLRAVNVGKANRCQPALIAKQLAKFGVLNIRAVGTFVVREDVRESALRAAIARKLPFKCEIMICPARDVIRLASKDSFSRQPLGPKIVRFVSVLAKRLRTLPPPSSHSALGQRLAGENHCDPRPIRPGSGSTADEVDQLPQPDREAPRSTAHHAQLAHDRKTRENSFSGLNAEDTENRE